MGRVLLMMVMLGACARPKEPVPAPKPPPPPQWPRFPTGAAEAAALVKAQTVAAGEAIDFRPERAFEAAERAGWQHLISGDRRVLEWVRAQRAAWLLAGTFHDSPEQARMFHHLIAPGGAGPFGTVALEQLRAPGAWLDADAGNGFDAQALERYLGSGSEADFEALKQTHLQHDYTAWKYGYDDELLQIVATARAGKIAVSACDVPDALMERLRDDDDSLRVRELHCKLTLAEAKTPVAMMWGQAHAGPDGFRRFLKEKALSLVMLGGRHSADAPDSEFRDRLVLNDPVLIPIREGYAWLWLPDRFVDGKVDRTRTAADATAPSIVASSEEPGTLGIGDLSFELHDDEKSKPLAAGEYTYRFRTAKGLTVVGSVEVPESGTAVLHFEPSTRTTYLTVAGPKYR
ncbi:MAG: hypothetical protein QM723_16760 [Myxococcaceae bacterium]